MGFSVRSIPHRWRGVLRDPNKSRYCGQRTEEASEPAVFGDRWGVAHGLALASWASRLLGLNEQAVAFGNESLALRRAEEDRYGEAESLALLAAAASANGDEATSLTLLQQSRGIRQAIGDRAGVAECDAELARIVASA